MHTYSIGIAITTIAFPNGLISRVRCGSRVDRSDSRTGPPPSRPEPTYTHNNCVDSRWTTGTRLKTSAPPIGARVGARGGRAASDQPFVFQDISVCIIIIILSNNYRLTYLGKNEFYFTLEHTLKKNMEPVLFIHVFQSKVSLLRPV